MGSPSHTETQVLADWLSQNLGVQATCYNVMPGLDRINVFPKTLMSTGWLITIDYWTMEVRANHVRRSLLSTGPVVKCNTPEQLGAWMAENPFMGN
jgi:hypothetical protein